MKNPFKKKNLVVRLNHREYKYKDYPGGGPYVDESLYDYHVRMWEALDPEVRKRATEGLRGALHPGTIGDFVSAAAKDPEDWMVEHHHFAGTALRNALRKFVKDNELPTGNWDDYYVMATEAACGLR